MGFTPTDIGEYIHPVIALGAAGTGTTAGTAVNGLVVDRFALPNWYNSVQLTVPFNYVLAAGGTINLNAHLQDSAVASSSSTSWADFGSTVQGAGSGGVTASSTASATSQSAFYRNVNLTTARRYVRARITPQRVEATAGSSADALNYHAVMVFGGAISYPA